MPANRFPFAVFVGRQIDLIGILQQRFELGDLLLFAGRNDVDRREVVIHVDAEIGPFLLLELRGQFLGALW